MHQDLHLDLEQAQPQPTEMVDNAQDFVSQKTKKDEHVR
jgi:hypothetical protein